MVVPSAFCAQTAGRAESHRSCGGTRARTRLRVGSPITLDPDEIARADVEFHRRIAATFDETMERSLGAYQEYGLGRFFERADPARGPVLDLGCGTGRVALPLVQRGFTVVGVDHSPEMLELARRKLERDAPARAWTLDLGDVRKLSYADASFAAVVGQGILHHLGPFEGAVTELLRVLQPGGVFYLSEPCRDGPLAKRVFERATWRLRRLEPPRRAPGEFPIVCRDLLRALDRAGAAYEHEFMLHFQDLAVRVTGERYIRLARALSRPWRARRGDIVFVHGTKPPFPNGETVVPATEHDSEV